MMKTLIVFAFLCCVASVCCFDLPMVFNIGSIDEDTERIDHEVKAAGPFVMPRNITFNFEWSTESHYMFGVRIRGTEPRYDRVSVEVRRLSDDGFIIQVTVINTTFALFWAEPMGFRRFSPELEQMKKKHNLA